jgi:hypothetical protein
MLSATPLRVVPCDVHSGSKAWGFAKSSQSPIDTEAEELIGLKSFAQVGAVSKVSQFQTVAKMKPKAAPTANVRRTSSPAVVAA